MFNVWFITWSNYLTNMPFTQGQILENEGIKYKILGVCGDIYLLSSRGDIDKVGDGYNEIGLVKYGYKPVAEKWEPKYDDKYWFTDSSGDAQWDYWSHVSGNCIWRKSIGNVFKTQEEAKAYKQYLLDNPYSQSK